MAEHDEAQQTASEVLDPTAPGTTDLPIDPAVVPRTAPSGRAWWVVAGCGAALAALTVAVASEAPVVIELDLAIHSFALSHRGSVDTALALAVTWAGATYVALPALLVVGCLAPTGRRSWRDRLGAGLLLAGTASVGIYAGLLLNHLVGRARPPAEDWWGAAGGPAFPSGHTTVATVVAVEAAWALTDRWPHRRRLLAAGAVAMAAAVGWSRVWLGVHWPTDVVGGWLLGVGWGVAVMLLLARLRRSRRGSGA